MTNRRRCGRLAATSGLRRGEALGLRWCDVDLDRGRVQITQTVTAIGWQIYIGQPKTQAGKRPIALDPFTVEVFREHHLLSERYGANVSGFVFMADDGGPMHPERMYQAFKRAVTKHRLPPIPLHGLRHTWATMALQSEVHQRVVQERLGDSNIAITLQTLSCVLPTMHDDDAATVAAPFMPARYTHVHGPSEKAGRLTMMSDGQSRDCAAPWSGAHAGATANPTFAE